MWFRMDPRKQPFKEKLIKNIKKDDFKVAVSGFIVNKKENAFVLDDGSGEILVISQEMPKEDFVKVFGIIMPIDDGLELQAEIIKDYSNVDKNLLKRVKELFE